LRSFLAAVGQLLDEAFDLLAAGIFEGLGAAEVDGIGFHQFGVELVLADDLAETVADLVTGTIAVPVSVGVLGRKLLCIRGRGLGPGIGPDLLDRADADAVGLAQGAIDRPGLGHAHLGATDER
jgi:hypothetical protein